MRRLRPGNRFHTPFSAADGSPANHLHQARRPAAVWRRRRGGARQGELLLHISFPFAAFLLAHRAFVISLCIRRRVQVKHKKPIFISTPYFSTKKNTTTNKRSSVFSSTNTNTFSSSVQWNQSGETSAHPSLHYSTRSNSPLVNWRSHPALTSLATANPTSPLIFLLLSCWTTLRPRSSGSSWILTLVLRFLLVLPPTPSTTPLIPSTALLLLPLPVAPS